MMINSMIARKKYWNFDCGIFEVEGGGLVDVVGYIRVSTKRQKEKGFSLEEQKEQITDFCADGGYVLLGIFSDKGLSGAAADEDDFTVERPGYNEMLGVIDEGGARAVVTLTTSRLWRSDTAKVIVWRDLKKRGCDVIAIDRPGYSIYTNDPNDFLVNGIMELLDVYERLDIKRKMTRGRLKKASGGGYSGGGVPFGYRCDKESGQILPVESEAEIVRRVFELLDSGWRYSFVDIADRLAREGRRDKKGKAISAALVRRIVQKRLFYAGVYRYAGVESEGKHPAIIEK
jgi:DNA invertase Pin-like site-specific DNA recombinase